MPESQKSKPPKTGTSQQPTAQQTTQRSRNRTKGQSKYANYGEWFNARLKEKATWRMQRWSHPTVLIDVTLQSQDAQRVYALHYGRCLDDLTNLSRTVASMCTADEFKAIQGLVRTYFEQVAAVLASEYKRARNYAVKEGVLATKVSYTNPVTIHAPTTTPEARSLLNLVKEVDRIVRVLDTLWLSETMGQFERDYSVNAVAELMEKFTARLHDYAGRAFRFAKARGKLEIPVFPADELELHIQLLPNDEKAQIQDTPSPADRADVQAVESRDAAPTNEPPHMAVVPASEDADNDDERGAEDAEDAVEVQAASGG